MFFPCAPLPASVPLPPPPPPHHPFCHTTLSHTTLPKHTTLTYKTLSHRTLSLTTLVTSTCLLRGRRGIWCHRWSLCVAGLLVPSAMRLCGRRGTDGTGLALVAHVTSRLFAFGAIDGPIVWHAWHLLPSTVTLCGWLWWCALVCVTAALVVWQAWHSVPSMVTLCHFLWQAWALGAIDGGHFV